VGYSILYNESAGRQRKHTVGNLYIMGESKREKEGQLRNVGVKSATSTPKKEAGGISIGGGKGKSQHTCRIDEGRWGRGTSRTTCPQGKFIARRSVRKRKELVVRRKNRLGKIVVEPWETETGEK